MKPFAYLALSVAVIACTPTLGADGGPTTPAPILSDAAAGDVLTGENYACMAATLADEFFIPPGTPADAIVQKLEDVCHLAPGLTTAIFGFINSFGAQREKNRAERRVMLAAEAGAPDAMLPSLPDAGKKK